MSVSRPEKMERREWHMRRNDESEEKKLELRLAPPGEENWSRENHASKNNRGRDDSLLSLGYFPSSSLNNKGNPNPTHNYFPSLEDRVLSSPWTKTQQNNQQQTKAPSFFQFPSTAPQRLPVLAKESSQPCCTKVVDSQNAEKKAFSPSANTAVTNGSQKRTAPAPVVGWPPIRSFRKNLASSSCSKSATESPNEDQQKRSGEKSQAVAGKKGLFVKINMDGVPIGRKVDLKAYDSYEKLSTAVDELFRGLLTAQRDSPGGTVKKHEEEKAITGVLDGSGEYTLVYEDNEGDRMLVGDVPWHMFVLTVKRLRVLKSSELSALSLGSNKQGRISA